MASVNSPSLQQELSTFCKVDKPHLEKMESRQARDPSFADKAGVTIFIVFMLVTMVIYVAWSIHHINKVNESLRQIVDQQSTAEGQADLFFKTVRKNK